MPAFPTKARDRLTAVAVRNLKEPGLYHDGNGLYLQVARGGSKSWILRFTLNKKTRDMGLGSADTFTLAEARTRALRQRQLLADGVDPIDKRKEELEQAISVRAAQKKQAVTFEECAREFHLANASQWKNDKHKDQWINTLATYVFPQIGRKLISSIELEDIRTVLLPIWKTKAETATRVLQRIRTVINYGVGRQYTEGLDAERWKQLRLALPGNKKELAGKHHSSCPHHDVGALLQRVADGPSLPAVKLAFKFTVLTAARSGEARGATWSEIDKERRLWVIPAERMKADREHSVPLSQTAWELIEQAKKLNPHQTGPDHLVFPNPKGLPFSDMTFTQILRRMGVPYVMHGFRASFRTWGADIGRYEHEVLEFALSHVVGDATVQAYLRTAMIERRRQLMDDWASYVTNVKPSI